MVNALTIAIVTWPGLFIVSVVAGYGAAGARSAHRLAAETAARVTQLAGPPVASPSCPTCAAPLQRAVKPHQGQTHYCARCELWMVVAGA